MERHELSEACGNMSSDELRQLRESVEAHGFGNPEIVTHEDKIVDGWHR